MRNTPIQPATLKDYLDDHVVFSLKKMVSFLKLYLIKAGIQPRESGTRKADLIAWLERHVKDPRCARALIGELGKVDGHYLQEAVHSPDGRVSRSLFRAKYGFLPDWGSEVFDQYRSRSRKHSAMSPVIFFTFADGRVPTDLLDGLKKIVPKPPPVVAAYLEELPESMETAHKGDLPLIAHPTEQAAIRDLTSILHLIDAGKVSVGAKTGKPTRAAVKAIRRILSHEDFYPEGLEAEDSWDVQMGSAGIRPFAWVLLVQAAKLAQISGSKLVLSRSGKAALKKPPHETLSHLWQRWLKTTTLHEVNRVEIVKGQKSKKRPLAAAGPCREAIESALCLLDVGRWIETESFLRLLTASGHEYDAVRNAWALHIMDAHYGNLGHCAEALLNPCFARVLLLEYAATLGLIDVALVEPWDAPVDLEYIWGADQLSCLSRYDGLHAIRLTPLGAWVLGMEEDYSPDLSREPSLTVLPNLDVTVLGSSFAKSDELFLDRVCERRSERVWFLSRDKAFEAIESGVEIESVVSFFEERIAGEMPRAAREALDDIGQRCQKVREVGEAKLIHCADETLAQLIAHDTALKKCCMIAGKQHIVVYGGREARFRRGMSEERRMQYALAPKRRQARIAAENPAKFAIVHELLEEYRGSRVLIIGEYIQQLRELQKELGLPLIEGKTSQRVREELYGRFRRGEARHLMLSRVGNFALDLPDADVLLQISGLFGSRQEEAQRLGRILRPKRNGQQAHFFTLVSQHTREEDFGRKRQLFLAEQGYSYELRFGTSCE